MHHRIILKKIPNNPNTLFLYDITSYEIKKHIDQLPAKNSSGYDNISNKLLKNIKYSIIHPLLHIFNLSLKLGVFPDAMKVSEIIPLFKKGQKDLMVNYRPISLLITLSKILEKCMYSHIYKFVTNNNIFYNRQYGFRSGHSCEQAIQNLYGHILQNKDNGIKTAAIYLDLSKAFDTITHNLLLEKLEKYGVCGVSNNWIKSYLSDRLIQVKCQTLSCNTTKISNQYQIKHGTPQGSCLGPLLFNLYCNDLYLNVEYCNLIMFTDDTTLYASHRNTTYLNHILQHDLLNLENWFAGNKLLLNVSKTYGMKFWDNPVSNITELTLNLNEKPIPLVTNTKFLGVTIDNDLTWTKHINNIIAKISVNKNLIGRSRNLLSTHAKKSVYYAHIYSHLAYAITVWGNSVTSKQKKNIETIQKYCIRAISNKPKTFPTGNLFKSLRIMRFTEIIEYELCKLGFNLKEKLLPEPLIKLFENCSKKTHPYSTRNKNLPNIRKHKSREYNNSFLCKSLTYINKLNYKIKNSKNKFDFMKNYKQQIFN